jgi:hypothetical protein
MKKTNALILLLLFSYYVKGYAGGFSGEVVTKIPIESEETQGLIQWLTGVDPNDTDLLKDANVRIGGAIGAGITYNPASPTDRSNGPVIFNDRSNEFQFNRFRLFAQRDVNSTRDKWDVGGRFDFIAGSDARFVNAVGLDDKFTSHNRFNKVALPQFYAQVFAPYGNGITAQIGHFFTVIGSINPFYSVSYVAYSEPTSHTGILLSTPINDNLTVSAGSVLGTLDTQNNFSKYPESWNFLGSATWTHETTTAIASIISGDDNSDLEGLGNKSSNRTHASLVINQDFAEKWHYKFQHDYGYQAQGFNAKAAQWYGVEQDLMYDITPHVTAGLRGEWFRDKNGLKIMFDGTPATYYGVTAGLFWKPVKWITIRPEVRYDVSSNPVYNDSTDFQQFTFVTSFVIKL